MDVGREGDLPLLVANVLDRLKARLMRGVVDQYVDPTEGLDRPLDNGAAMRRIADIAGDQQRLAARLLNQSLRLGGVLILGQIGNDHIRAFAGKGDGDGAADAAVRASDDRFLIGQLAMADIAVFAMIGARIHRLGLTGHVLLLFGLWWGGAFVHGPSLLARSNGRGGEPFRKKSVS